VIGDSVKLRGVAVIPFELGVSVGVGGSVGVDGLGGVDPLGESESSVGVGSATVVRRPLMSPPAPGRLYRLSLTGDTSARDFWT